jgi:hypothetical protein
MNGNEKDEYYFSSWMAEMLHNFEAYISLYNKNRSLFI